MAHPRVLEFEAYGIEIKTNEFLFRICRYLTYFIL